MPAQFNTSLPAARPETLDQLQMAMLSRNDSLQATERVQMWSRLPVTKSISSLYTPGDDVFVSDPIRLFTQQQQELAQRERFTVTMSFLVPSQRIDILAAPSTVILFGWSQYVPLALLVYVFLAWFRNFLLRNQILSTIVRRDTTPITKQHQF